MFAFRHLRRNPVPTFGRNPVPTFGRTPVSTFGRNPVSTFGRLPRTFAFAAFRHTPSSPSGIRLRPYNNQ
jgi:hypothetical protein